MRILTFSILILFSVQLYSQKIDNMVSFRDFDKTSYFRFNYENDYFAATDRNYTQGYSFEFGSPVLKKNPINHLFLKPKNTIHKYGLAFEHIGFTPKNLSSHEIQVGDRPYAAAMMLKSFDIAIDTQRRLRLVSSFNLGVIGPIAIGYEIQSGIHAAIDGVEPSGWKYQIENHVVLNYEIAIEKQLININNQFNLQTNTYARLGTLFTNASIGLNANLGNLNNGFGSPNPTKKFKWYVYGQPLVNAIAYDATLQGGLINDKSVYTIPKSDIEHFTFQVNYGLVLQFGGMYLEYSRAYLTKEFSTGTKANWGGVHVGVSF